MCLPECRCRSLKDIAQEKHLPDSYAQPWALPSTAVQAYPPMRSEGTPGMAPANPADPAIKIPRKQTGRSKQDRRSKD